MKILLLLLMVFGISGCFLPYGNVQKLSIMIQAEDFPRVTVCIKNRSLSWLRIWRDGNSMGWDNLTFYMRDTKTGQTYYLHRLPTSWTANVIQTISLYPGQIMIQRMDLNDGTWVIPKELAIKNCEIRARFHSRNSKWIKRRVIEADVFSEWVKVGIR